MSNSKSLNCNNSSLGLKILLSLNPDTYPKQKRTLNEYRCSSAFFKPPNQFFNGCIGRTILRLMIKKKEKEQKN
ncbi:hypothetical protein BpHYR1_043950 [Brachionus plicatilis]|uniref:Uncharacterized protein n=1 Tax=Brachionus plicatilis TaxID=10195 RepID=A0A3M7QVY5_BRAPC|nr:hypothetical protein BpHYR1_043950 [Brachionus plicatilis]